MDVWPQPAHKYNIIWKAGDAIWGKRRKIHAEANAENTSAAPHHVVIHHVDRWYFQHLPPLVFSVLAPYCIFCFGPVSYSMYPWAVNVFSVLVVVYFLVFCSIYSMCAGFVFMAFIQYIYECV